MDSFFRWSPGLPGSLSLGSGLETRWGYLLALVASLLALALTLLAPGSHQDPIFVYFLLAILVTQFVAGARPALLAVALSFTFLIELAPPLASAARVQAPPESFRLLNFFLMVLIVLALNTRSYLLRWQSRHWKRKFLATAPVRADMSLFEWDLKTGEMVWSEQLNAIRDLSPGESFSNRVSKHDLQQVYAALAQAATAGTAFEVRYRVTGADGDERRLAVTGQFLKGRHRPRWAMGTITDVTKWLSAQERLRTNERHFELAQKATMMATWEWAVGSPRVQWSPCSGPVYGYPEQDFDLTVEQFLRAVHPLDRPRLQRLLREAIDDKTDYEVEFRYHWPDGSQHWLFARVRVFLNEQGTASRMVGVTMEITARKQAEEALRASEKLAANGRLAATLAHEINNPLQSLRSLLYLMEQQGEPSPTLRRYIELGQREVTHSAEIVRQTLGLYREPQGIVAVSPRREVEQVLAMCRRRVQLARIDIEARFEFDGAVRVLPGEIRQIATNLLLNALDAGSRHITIRLHRSKAANPTGPNVFRLVVADDGAGIPRSITSRLFEPFFTTKGEQGTGLGLWVIRNIVDKYGGSVRMRSSVDPLHRGTVFMVSLPADPWTAEERGESSPAESGRLVKDAAHQRGSLPGVPNDSPSAGQQSFSQ